MSAEISETLAELFKEDVYNIPPRLTIVIPCAWSELQEEEVSLLTKILASVKRRLSEVRIIHRDGLTPEELPLLDAAQLIAFGTAVEGVQPYQSVDIDGVKVIVADRLTALDDPKKKSLWLALKQMFSL